MKTPFLNRGTIVRIVVNPGYKNIAVGDLGVVHGLVTEDPRGNHDRDIYWVYKQSEDWYKGYHFFRHRFVVPDDEDLPE